MSDPRPKADMMHLALCSLLCATSTPPQNVRLSHLEPATAAQNEVGAFQITGDGAYAVYLAPEEREDRDELFVRPTDLSEPSVKLNPELAVPAASDVGTFVLTPDSTRVLFHADTAAFGSGLFVAALQGGGNAQLLMPMASSDLIRVSPDSSFAVVRATTRSWVRVELDGSAPPTPLHTPLVSQFLLGDGHLSPDGTRFVFLTQRLLGFETVPDQAFSSAVDGSGTAALAPGEDSYAFLFLPGTTDVVLRTVQSIHRTSSDGAGPVQLLAGSIAGGEFDSLAATADGSRLLCTAAHRALYSLPADGSSPPVRLDPDLASVPFVRDFRVSATGAHVLFALQADSNTFFDLPPPGSVLHRAPVVGGTPSVEVASATLPGGGIGAYSLTTDDAEVVFLADAVVDDQVELWRVPFAGGAAATRLSGVLPAGGDVDAGFFEDAFLLAAGDTRVIYRADQDEDGDFGIFTVPLDGSDPSQRLSPTLPRPGRAAVEGLALSPAGDDVYFRHSTVLGSLELYRAAPDSPAQTAVVNGPLVGPPFLSLVASFELDPTGRRVAYRRYDLETGEDSLFGVPLDGSAPITQLNDAVLEDYGRIVDFEFSSSGGSVSYRTSDSETLDVRLWVAPSDGASPPVQVSPVEGPGEVLEVELYGFTADESHVVFEARVDDVPHLYSTPADGSSAPLLLLPAGTELASWTLSPGSDQVFFVVELAGLQDLFSVPLTGGPLRRISGPPAASSVVDVGFDDQGSRVFYRHRQGNDPIAVFSAPVDGSTPATELSLPTGLFAARYHVRPDGAWAVIEREDPSGAVEFYGVPTDGSAPAVMFDSTFSTSAAFEPRLRFEPLTQQVIYQGGVTAGAPRDFFVAGVDGSLGPTALLLAPTPPLELAQSFLVSHETGRVAYRVASEGSSLARLWSGTYTGAFSSGPLTDRFVNAVGSQGPAFALAMEGTWVVFQESGASCAGLFAAPVDGIRPPHRLDVCLQPFGRIREFKTLPHMEQVVFLGDLEHDGVDELFVSRVAGPGLHQGTRAPAGVGVGGSILVEPNPR